MTRPTPTRQRNSVSAGMALALVLCGRTSILLEKWRDDLAFEGAWRSWPHRVTFPQVNTDVTKGMDGTWVMVRADERKGTWPFFWETSGRKLEIFSRADDWDEKDPEDVRLALQWLDGDVPLQGWIALAQDFLIRYDQ